MRKNTSEVALASSIEFYERQIDPRLSQGTVEKAMFLTEVLVIKYV